MKQLGQVDTIICSKAAFLNHSLKYVAAFKLKQNFYLNSQTDGNVVKNKKAEDKQMNLDDLNLQSEKSAEEDEIEEKDEVMLEYLPNQIQLVQGFKS